MLEQNKAVKLNRIELIPADQLQPGQRLLVEVDGIEIAVTNVDGKWYAFRNSCPHQGVSLVFGAITGTMMPSQPQEYQYGCDNELIRCPLHGWEFHMKTGKSMFQPDKVSILTYEAAEEEGTVVLYMKRLPKKVEIKRQVCFGQSNIL
ncbi:Rieske (2Fe-2S) protein [Brevibacillus sp. B_LB10_24]|uniref:Rieske (2Fe-2S) protein n=1 Tax=Brevibacillus sp. B_LB10_24 TaxID=3380645 RepID=UPI0038B723F7